MPKKGHISAIVPYYGANRLLAENVGKALTGCDWVGIPFAGSLPEVPFITARTIIANDICLDVMNLARTIADPVTGPKLYRALRRQIFHPHTLKTAQVACLSRPPLFPDKPDLTRALHYFVAAWMGRNGKAGTAGEFKGGLAVRWSAGGGDSAVRFHAAVSSLRRVWRPTLRRCSFTAMDGFKFIETAVAARAKGVRGLYCDPPFPGPGDLYMHKFTTDDHRRLAKMLNALPRDIRCVVRYYDHALVRELYPEQVWTWQTFTGRDGNNQIKPERLLIRKGQAHGPIRQARGPAARRPAAATDPG